MIKALVMLSAATAATPASRYPMPGFLAPPHMEGPSSEQPARTEPIGGYTLALLWLPEHCVRTVPGAESLTCRHGMARGFALHGLWPDGLGASWPQWCAPAPLLSRRTVRRFYWATPSPQLLQHEWAKHGTCMKDMDPDRYFTLSNRLFDRVRYPDMQALARKPTTVGAVATAFAAVNPGIRPDHVRLNLDSQNWLREIWLCLDKIFRSAECDRPTPPDRPVRIRLPD